MQSSRYEVRSLILALNFLTVIPLKKIKIEDEKILSHSCAYFPLVGLLIGLSLYLIGKGALYIFSYSISSSILITYIYLITGALHLDGLSDTTDALLMRPGVTRSARISVMKDSRVGVMGVMGIIVVILLRYSSFKFIMERHAFLYLSMMPVISRWILTTSIYHGNPARGEGLGHSFMKGFKSKDLWISTSILALIVSLFSIIFKDPIIFGIILFMYFISILLIRLFDMVFGGINGDNLGAIVEVSEVIFLLSVSALNLNN